MPFKSKQQRKWMYANDPEMAARWEKHTPDDTKLPEKVQNKKKKQTKKALDVSKAHRMLFFIRLASDMDYNRKFLEVKQPINILFFTKLTKLVAPEAEGEEKSNIQNNLFISLIDSKIHDVINHLASLVLDGKIDGEQVNKYVTELVNSTYETLN